MKVTSNGKIRRTAEEWTAILAAHSSSGLSRRAFCEREGLHVESFTRWHRKLRGLDKTPSTAPFVELQTRAEAPVATVSSPSELSWSVEIALASGTIVRLRD